MPNHSISHDASYKALFRHKAIVKSLLLDFIPDSFVKDFDFETLEDCRDSHSTDDLRQRHNDIIWRLRWKDAWCYIYIILEFQSSQDHWMGLRVLCYTALLWENLVKSGHIKKGEKLPPVFPIVLYNGKAKWAAPTELSDLILPIHPSLDAYQPQHKYRLLDQKRIKTDDINKAEGEAAYIMRVEQANSYKEIFNLAIEFDSKNPQASLDSASLTMLEWMDQKIKWLRTHTQPGQGEEPCQEASMLAELIAQYKAPYIQEGRAEGRAEGMAEGMAKGRLEGRAEGMAKGRLEGRAEGMRGLVKNMLLERFGKIPQAWETALSRFQNQEQFAKLSSAIYKAGSREEFENFLNKLD